MSYDEKKLYIITAAYTLSLLLVPFVAGKAACNICLSVLSVLGAVVGAWLIKKRQAHDLHKKEVIFITSTAAALAVMIICLSGLYFGFYKNNLSAKILYTYVLPITAVVTATEIFRRVLLSQKQKIIRILSCFIFVFSDIILFAEKNSFRNAANFMTLLGLVILPALSSNFLYCKLSAKYGTLSVIPYRLIISLYAYILPFGSAVPRALLAFAKIIFPLILLWFVQKLFGKRTVPVSKKRTVAGTVSTVLCLALMLFCISFMSGVFRHKAIVVASDSMKGEFETGDLLIYETYDGQVIENQQIILFKRNKTIVIHRVVDIKKINGVYRYYTKGDANDGMDTGYVTDEDIIGITTMKIKYIGYPTVWINDIFKK